MRSRFSSWREVRRSVCLLAATAGLLAAPLSHATAQIAVDELEAHLKLGRDSVLQAIAVRNESDSVQQVRITLNDWYRDSLGTNVFVNYGTHASSCREKLSVFPLTLQLPPRSTDFVRLTYRSSGVADEGCWGIVLIEPVRPPVTVSGAQATAELTILNGVKIYVHRAQEQASGEVVYADVEAYNEAVTPGVARSDSTLVRDIAVRYENTGTSHLVVNSTIEIRDETTQVVKQITGPVAYITPGAIRDFIIRIPALPRGRYVAIVLLDSGDDEVQATQVDFEIP